MLSSKGCSSAADAKKGFATVGYQVCMHVCERDITCIWHSSIIGSPLGPALDYIQKSTGAW